MLRRLVVAGLVAALAGAALPARAERDPTLNDPPAARAKPEPVPAAPPPAPAGPPAAEPTPPPSGPPAAGEGAEGNGAPARVYATVTGPQLQAWLRAVGIDSRLDREPDRSPIVIAAADGTRFVIYAFDCDRAPEPACTGLQFAASFQGARPLPTEGLANGWNLQRRIGQAVKFPDERIGLRHPVVLAGGMTEANFRAQLALWRQAVREFRLHIGFDR
jgi:hypothetical protein